MTESRKTSSFKRSDEKPNREAEPETAKPTSFWRRLFGGGPVNPDQITRNLQTAEKARKAATGKPTPRRTGSLSPPMPTESAKSLPLSALPHEAQPRNPKSFLAKKFNSQVVKTALMDNIGEAMDNPPAGIDPIDAKFWVEGLAMKGVLVEHLDCASLTPGEHLKAIQWMAKIEGLDPLKATYREDLFTMRFNLAKLAEKEPTSPEAIGQGGIALRKLYQVVRQKFAILDDNALAVQEIEAYEALMAAIDRAPIARLDPDGLNRVANAYRRIDPYRHELTGRHPKFQKTVDALIAEMDDLYSAAPALH